jgi:hypothetical protein
VAAAAAAAAVSGVAIDSAATDIAGVVTVTTGTTGAAGALATVTFSRAFKAAPEVILVNRADTVADAAEVHVSAKATNSFVIRTASTPGNAETLLVQYLVIPADGEV